MQQEHETEHACAFEHAEREFKLKQMRALVTELAGGEDLPPWSPTMDALLCALHDVRVQGHAAIHTGKIAELVEWLDDEDLHKGVRAVVKQTLRNAMALSGTYPYGCLLELLSTVNKLEVCNKSTAEELMSLLDETGLDNVHYQMWAWAFPHGK